MTTEKIDIKQIQKKNIELSLSNANRRAENFKNSQNEIESIYRKFFDEINKKCDYFLLKETEHSESFRATIFGLNSDGSSDYSKTIPIDIIEVNYKTFNIIIKPNVCKASVYVYIDEEIKHRRRGGSKNEGWKIKVKINYKESPTYKTGGSVVKLVNEQIDLENRQRLHNEMVESNRLKIKGAISEFFPLCSIETVVENKYFYVNIRYGVKLKISTTINDDGTVLITPIVAEFTNKNIYSVKSNLEMIY